MDSLVGSSPVFVGGTTPASSYIYFEDNHCLFSVDTPEANVLEFYGVSDFYCRHNYFQNASISIITQGTVSPLNNIQITDNRFYKVQNTNINIRWNLASNGLISNVLIADNLVEESGNNAGSWNKSFANVGEAISGSDHKLENITITGNTLNRAALCAIGDSAAVTKNVTITGNSCSDLTLDGESLDKNRLCINASFFDGLNITGNSFIGYGGTPIYLVDGTNFVVSNNTLQNFGFSSALTLNPAGIYFYRCDYGTINGNTIMDFGGSNVLREAGIGSSHHTGVDHIVVTNNVIKDRRDDTTNHTNTSIIETEIAAGTEYSHLVTTATHGLNPGDKVTLAGVTPSGLNAEWLVHSTPTPTTYVFLRSGTTLGNSTVHGTSTGVKSSLIGVRIGDSGTGSTGPQNWIVKNNIIENMATQSIYPLTGNAVDMNITIDGNMTYHGDKWEPFTASDTTPAISSWNQYFKTANSSATTITDFDNNVTTGVTIPNGHTIYVLIDDANTTFDFTSNTEMTGNSGADLSPGSGNVLTFMYDQINDIWRLINYTAQ
jgi:hypothetical protein